MWAKLQQISPILFLVCDGIHAELQEKINFPRGKKGFGHKNNMTTTTETTAWWLTSRSALAVGAA